MADDAEKPHGEEQGARDYRATIFLPDTPFPMRAGLPQKEPQILERWRELDLYNAIRAERQKAGRPLFVL
ncbi:MAG: ileS, partial [Phenylobacterium sp.]|nr:ileS [Phenylobacterium sp.]